MNEKAKKTDKKEHQFNDKLEFKKTKMNNLNNSLTSDKTFKLRKFDTQDIDLFSKSFKHGNNPHGKTDITSFNFKYDKNKKVRNTMLISSLSIMAILVLLLIILTVTKVI